MTFARFTQRLGALAAAAALAACGATNPDTGAAATATGPSAAVDPATTTDCTQATRNPARVVCLATAFKATLTADQVATFQLAYTAANAATWSNFPTSVARRVGIRLGDLSATQQAAALNLAKAALGAAGYGTFQSIRAADGFLSATGFANATTNFGEGRYFLSVLGTPSTTGPWMLKIDGHHLAINLHYNGAQAPTATPHFIGVEPGTFTWNGVTYTPLESRKGAMYAMVNALDSAQAAAAQLTTSFSDVLLGPGQDARSLFPARQGIAYSALSASQQALVQTAVREWVSIQPANEASALLATYFSPAALANTSIAWSGSRDSTVRGSYVRIDGPRVWIELAAQPGIVFTAIHYHTIWRDREEDYGGDFTFTAPAPGGPGGPGGPGAPPAGA